MIRVMVPAGEGAWTSVSQTAMNLLLGFREIGVHAQPWTVPIRRNARVGAYLYPILYQATARQPRAAGTIWHSMIPQLVVRGVQGCCIHDTWTMALPGGLSRLQRIHYRWAVRRSGLIAVTSPTVGETLTRWFGPGPTYVPDTGVAVAAPERGRSSSRWDVLWIGSASPNKRPTLFLDLLRARSRPLSARMICHPNRRWPEEFRRAEAMTRLPGLEFSWDTLPVEQVEQAYRTARCIVSTSIPGGEGFHLPIFEAYARGTHAVVPRGPPYDWIYRGARGVHYYESSDPSSLQAAVDDATSAADFAPDSDLLARYSPGQVARRLLEGYQRLGLGVA